MKKVWNYFCFFFFFRCEFEHPKVLFTLFTLTLRWTLNCSICYSKFMRNDLLQQKPKRIIKKKKEPSGKHTFGWNFQRNDILKIYFRSFFQQFSFHLQANIFIKIKKNSLQWTISNKNKLSCTFTTHDEYEYRWIIMIRSHSDHFYAKTLICIGWLNSWSFILSFVCSFFFFISSSYTFHSNIKLIIIHKHFLPQKYIQRVFRHRLSVMFKFLV